MIEIENVSHAIGGAPILQEVTTTIPEGGVTALIGPNGAGKSTLMALMARLEPLQTGRIRFDGLDVATTPTGRLALKLAIQRQDTTVGSRLRVHDLVAFGRFPHHRGRPGPADRAATEEAVEAFGLSPLAGRFVDELSGGERQRALVAMAFAQGTDYLLLDEPLNNLDMFHARELMRRLRTIADAGGRTVVVVLHEVNYAAAYADRIVALRQGRLAAEGTPGEILEPETLRRLYGMEIAVQRDGDRLFVMHHV